MSSSLQQLEHIKKEYPSTQLFKWGDCAKKEELCFEEF